jgi:hypothetical protein
LLLSVWVLSQVPPPSIEDEALRTPRRPMTGPERVAFFRRFAPGLIILILSYMFLTAYRDFRDNFLADIWSDLRSGGAHPEFSQTETPIALAVLGVLMLIALVKKNIRALMVNHIAVGVGPLLAGIAAFCFQQGWISDFMLILITGFGAYIAYIPFNSILFERMIATFKYVSNVGFLMYLSDAFGYLGSVGELVYKNVGAKGLSWTQFFINASYIAALTGCVGALAAWLYFRREHQREEAKQLEPVADL